MIASLFGCLAIFLFMQTEPSPVGLSPKHWGQAELEKYVRTERIAESIPKAEFAMITGTSSSIALRAGLEALQQGGSAVDAALCAALTHTTLAGGCTVSFAGVITLVYYDAERAEAWALDGGYSTVREETDPRSIPLASRFDPSQVGRPIPKGRTVLVPGFLAGLEAAHARFGKLPWAELFQPAIYFAEQGFPISEGLSRLSLLSKEILSRVPETRAVFFKEDGSHYLPGERFKQPALARTLRRISTEGTGYCYQGDWARKFVQAVQRDGGKLTLADLAGYEARWHQPLQADFHGHQVHLATGGINLTGMLHLLERSGLVDRGYYSESAEAFFWFCRIFEAVNFGVGLEDLPGQQEDWLRPEFAAQAWAILQKKNIGSKTTREENPPRHSDALVAVDSAGNMAALLYSSNTRSFGETGLYIDGISIPDSATFQQALLSVTEPGDRLFNPTAPLVVVKDGKPVLGLSAIGSGIYEETYKCLYNMLGFGKNPQEAIDAPKIVPFFSNQVNAASSALAIATGDFPDSTLQGAEGLGLELTVLPKDQARRTSGAAAIVAVDPDSGGWEAGSARRFSLGY